MRFKPIDVLNYAEIHRNDLEEFPKVIAYEPEHDLTIGIDLADGLMYIYITDGFDELREYIFTSIDLLNTVVKIYRFVFDE